MTQPLREHPIHEQCPVVGIDGGSLVQPKALLDIVYAGGSAFSVV
jgi:hypothetical protein